MSLSPRRRRTAEERAAKGYPRVMGNIAVVEDQDWMSQFDAAEALHCSAFRIGSLIANEHLVPAETEAGVAGVTKASVDAEHEWRSSVSMFRRALRVLQDTVRWL